MKAPWSQLPALPAAVGMVAGLILSYIGLSWWLTCALAIVCGVALYAAKMHYVAFILFFTAIGSAFFETHRPEEVEHLYGAKYNYTAIIEIAHQSDNSAVYNVRIVKAEGQSCNKFLCRLTVFTGRAPIPVGSEINFWGCLQPTSSDPDLPYEVDYGKFLTAEGIVCKCAVVPENVEILRGPGQFDALINRIRDCIYNAIVDSDISGASASMLVATLLGDDSLLSSEIYAVYRSTGTAHILALSGLHVGILVGIMAFLLLPLQALRRGAFYRSVFTIILVWSYVVIVGWSPSIVRAAVMVTTFICARHIQDGYNSFNALLLSIVVILCINPLWLFTPGFQMSVSAVASLLLASSLLPKRIMRHPVCFWIMNFALVPVAAIVGTGIITAYYFHTFPLLFFVANIAVGILFPPFLTLGLIAAVLCSLGINIPLISWIVDCLYDMMHSVICLLSSYEWAHVGNIFFSAWAMLPYYLSIALTFVAVKFRNKVLGIYAVSALLAFVVMLRVTREHIPHDEFYIPKRTMSSCMVFRSGSNAWLYTDATDRDTEIQNCTSLYSGFLGSRRCERFILIPDSVSSFSTGIFQIKFPYVVVGDRLIYIVDSDTLRLSSQIAKVDYALICRGYTGSVNSLYNSIQPDTLLFGAGLHPSFRKKIIRECADSVPYVDLRYKSVKLLR